MRTWNDYFENENLMSKLKEKDKLAFCNEYYVFESLSLRYDVIYDLNENCQLKIIVGTNDNSKDTFSKKRLMLIQNSLIGYFVLHAIGFII